MSGDGTALVFPSPRPVLRGRGHAAAMVGVGTRLVFPSPQPVARVEVVA
ncbi:MAG TPA: hypothetical protein VGM33_05560 [Baekduia sp.]|jgi:hypothetical protein